MAEKDIKGKSVLITGGASGLGALYAEAFLKEGAANVAIVDIQEDVGEATAKRLNNTYPGKVLFIKCDVGSEDTITAAFEQVVSDFNQVDVIINNAGIMSDAPQLWRKASDVNWQGVVSLTMKGVKHMRKDEGGAGGTIINIASTAAIHRWRYLPIYSGSKLAVLHFSQSLAVEPFYEQTGVRILTLCPGPTDTALLVGLRDRAYDDKAGEELVAVTVEHRKRQDYQKPESAVAACLQMFKEGANGSIWMSVSDKPVRDITANISRAFEEFDRIQLE